MKSRDDSRDTRSSVEGLVNLMSRTPNEQMKSEFKKMIDSAMEFWFAKCSLLLHRFNIYGPINAVRMYQTFEENLLLKKFRYSIRMFDFILRETFTHMG